MVQRIMAAAARQFRRPAANADLKRRRMVVLHLHDDVLVIYAKEPTRKPGQSYVDGAVQLIKNVFTYSLSEELYSLKPFQRDLVEWHPVYGDWSVMLIDRASLHERIDHDCDVRSIIGHEFEELLHDRLPYWTRDFMKSLRNKKQPV